MHSTTVRPDGARKGTERALVAETVGIIVGSGFAMLGFEIAARSPTKTPYGEPSSPVLTMRIGEQRVACIARHGEQHALAPHDINYRANLWALHERGVRTCIGVNTVGAIAPGFAPGDLAVPDQLIDYTSGRTSTFGGNGTVIHVDFTEPFDPTLRDMLAAAVDGCGYGVRGGTYGATQGPRLETAAEIDRLERDGCAMVGMTAMPEAALARELGWAYAICAVAVNYAAGRSPSGAPIMAEIAASMALGMQRVAEVVRRVTPRLTADAL
jgi:5'-deoxy-5'-methylthioadenosine phosphorylase